MVMDPPFPDPKGDAMFFVPAPPGTKDDRARKLLRRDFLTSLTAAQRAVLAREAEMVFGIGQGATIAAGLCRPRVLEVALASKTVTGQEARELAPAWHRLRAVLVTAPQVFKSRSDLHWLIEAVPELKWPPAAWSPACPCSCRSRRMVSCRSRAPPCPCWTAPASTTSERPSSTRSS